MKAGLAGPALLRWMANEGGKREGRRRKKIHAVIRCDTIDRGYSLYPYRAAILGVGWRDGGLEERGGENENEGEGDRKRERIRMSGQEREN